MKFLSLSSVSIFSVARVAASSDSFGSNSPSSSPYYYSEIHSQDFEKDLQDTYSEADDFSDSSSVVASSQLYDGGCYVSSQAMMCNGGDSLMNTLEFDTDEDFSDDEDNDEDDGHSSMLSNASLRRSKALANRSVSAPKSYRPATASEPTTAYFEGEVKLSKKAATTAAFMVRGGAAASTSVAKNDLAKKIMVAAIVTLVFEGLIGHVLEFFKIVMQTSPPGTTYGQVFKDITLQKGFAGLWDGFVPWGVIQAVLKGGVFGLAHATASKSLMPLAAKGVMPKQLAMALAGGIGGGFQGYVLSPTLLMKTRVMTNPAFREQMSMLKTTWLSFAIGAEVVGKEGFLTLMKGANVFATKRVFDWSTRYFFSDMFEAFFVKVEGKELTNTEKSLASFLGGVASTCATLPLDVLVAKTQDAKKAGVAVSAIKMFNDELSEVGWSGLRGRYMQGFEARLLHVCLTTVVLKTGAPIVYEKFFGECS